MAKLSLERAKVLQSGLGIFRSGPKNLATGEPYATVEGLPEDLVDVWLRLGKVQEEMNLVLKKYGIEECD